jgi:hypothetical protein
MLPIPVFGLGGEGRTQDAIDARPATVDDNLVLAMTILGASRSSARTTGSSVFVSSSVTKGHFFAAKTHRARTGKMTRAALGFPAPASQLSSSGGSSNRCCISSRTDAALRLDQNPSPRACALK